MSNPDNRSPEQCFGTLFTPIRVGNLTLKNRVVALPTQSGLSSNHRVSSKLRGLYTARARGGAGLVMVEPGSVEFVNTESNVGIYDDRFIGGLKELVDIAHRNGAAIGIQIIHLGRQWPPGSRGRQPSLYAPSAIPWAASKQVPRELTIAEIERIEEDFVAAARRAKQAGFDLVEIHAAHGYLISQFFSKVSNRRRDVYGGDLAGRTRFAVEIIRRVKEVVAPDMVLSCRLNGADHVRGGPTLNDMKAIASTLVGAGLDMISISAGVYGSYPTIVPPYDMPKGCYVDYAEGIKSVVDVPVVAAGRIIDPLQAEEILEKGKADLIGLGRSLIADPEWPNKAMRGETDDIRTCIACNQCLDAVDRNELMCAVNPTLINEKESEIVPASRRKEVMVVGGGLAGLEAAKHAASRGHNVTLYEERRELGGQWRLAAVSPHRQAFGELLRYLVQQAKRAGVKIVLGKKITAKTIEDQRPDVLIIATGALPRVPPIPGTEGEGVFFAWDVLEKRCKVGEKVLVVGGSGVGLGTADFLSEQGASVTVVELRRHIGADLSTTVRWHLLHRLREKKVKVLTATEVKRIGRGEVVVASGGGGKTLRGFDAVILAVGARSRNELASEARDKVPEIYVIGDALEPRQGADALRDGNRIGREV